MKTETYFEKMIDKIKTSTLIIPEQNKLSLVFKF